jgi:predicted methyltransferase
VVSTENKTRRTRVAPHHKIRVESGASGYDSHPCAFAPLSEAILSHYTGPLLTRPVAERLIAARDINAEFCTASFDLGRSEVSATLGKTSWQLKGASFPYPSSLKDRTIYFWDGDDFSPISSFGQGLIKLVPTEWGAPTFEIDGVKMLPTAKVSPFEDARSKVALVQVRGKHVLDTCGGLGYFAANCLAAGAAQIQSFEKNRDVLWLRTLNPWSPDPEAAEFAGRLKLTHGDISREITELADASFDAVLHDPPRFGIAGELYSQMFYDHLSRVLRRSGRLFHYTGSPNKLTSGRDVPREVSSRLQKAGFKTELILDGVLAIRR